MKTFTTNYLFEAREILDRVDVAAIERIATLLSELKSKSGRVFFLGVGGGASHCSHAASDLRKLAGIECYAPTDNVSELTARVNDEGWTSVFTSWLRTSHLCNRDMVFVFSVGGGDVKRNVSANIVNALKLAKRVGATIVGVVGRDGGYTAKAAHACVIIPTVNPKNLTAHTESFQAVVWHLLVSHPIVRSHIPKWESLR